MGAIFSLRCLQRDAKEQPLAVGTLLYRVESAVDDGLKKSSALKQWDEGPPRGS